MKYILILFLRRQYLYQRFLFLLVKNPKYQIQLRQMEIVDKKSYYNNLHYLLILHIQVLCHYIGDILHSHSKQPQ
uniref:Uncharacterized protein n=1 Tax=Siphoviridae sp. ctxMM9 TaxID=2827973 RepID=A0A8S5T778_9CAUD|nr:MAG TPA: hypothetical protein [Siphoviridae sp. ctxMM9]